MNDQANHSIKCSVSSCAHHCTTDYCTLNEIKVGHSDSNVKSRTSTECDSFELGAGQNG